MKISKELNEANIYIGGREPKSKIGYNNHIMILKKIHALTQSYGKVFRNMEWIEMIPRYKRKWFRKISCRETSKNVQLCVRDILKKDNKIGKKN